MRMKNVKTDKKRLFAVLLLLVMTFFVVGCSGESDIVGLWKADGDKSTDLIEFTSDGQFFSHFGNGNYQILDDGTIEINTPEGELSLTDVNISKNTIKAVYTWWGAPQTFNRIKGYSNLGNDVAGIWTSKIDGDSITFTFDESGKFNMADENGNIASGNFTVLSNHTIRLNAGDGQVIHFYIMNLSKTQFTAGVWEEDLESYIFTKQ